MGIKEFFSDSPEPTSGGRYVVTYASDNKHLNPRFLQDQLNDGNARGWKLVGVESAGMPLQYAIIWDTKKF